MLDRLFYEFDPDCNSTGKPFLALRRDAPRTAAGRRRAERAERRRLERIIAARKRARRLNRKGREMERLDARPKRGAFHGRGRVRRSGQRLGWTASVGPPTGKYELAIGGWSRASGTTPVRCA